jgi:hypothetical protein
MKKCCKFTWRGNGVLRCVIYNGVDFHFPGDRMAFSRSLTSAAASAPAVLLRCGEVADV